MAASDFPPAPSVSGDAQLEIFVHHSAERADQALFEPYGNGRRLGIQGASMFVAAYTAALFELRRDLQGNQLQVR